MRPMPRLAVCSSPSYNCSADHVWTLSQTASPDIIAEQFQVSDLPLFPPRYNIAPFQPIVAIRIEPDTTRAHSSSFAGG